MPRGKGRRNNNREITTARIAGVISAYAPEAVIHRGGIAEDADVDLSTASGVVEAFVNEGLLAEAGMVRVNRRGNLAVQYQATDALREAVQANPEWRRAAQIRELMAATGMEEGEVLDYALELARRSLLRQAETDGE